jgi:hypothetical protein
MQLIAIGDNLINLDQISVLDIDRTQTGAVVRVKGNQGQSIIEININPQSVNDLFNLVGSGIRVPGTDDQFK